MADYHKIGLLTLREGRILLCRKKHSTSHLILPGGCVEPGESPVACLERELHEELGEVAVHGLEYVGAYEDRAASDDAASRKTVRIELYRGTLEGTPEPHSEIVELVWFGSRDDRTRLAPSIVNRILPDLLARGLLPWEPEAVPVELLAPARDLECGISAIDCGADAVYIGAPRFGAREAAGNSLDDIRALAAYAHKFRARVYVTLNTLLFDDELPHAVRLAHELYDAGIDGLIIQDVGLLECDLPPVPLIGSTQMHNATPERVAFLEQVGISRAILARELSLDEIRAIRRAAPRIELEFFVHGALCVCYSGQCYLSYALGGRSGNRGQCAQPCRKSYTLEDASGSRVASGHLLSLRDLNLSANLGELLDAGVTSFKIEGRLKDRGYVANAVAHYRALLDEAIAGWNACAPAESRPPLRRSSSGRSSPGFSPNPARTFNRGFTTYFLHGRSASPGFPATPKMAGEEIGRVTEVRKSNFTLENGSALHPGDGICFFDREGVLSGTVVNGVQGDTVTPDRMAGIEPGIVIHRNHDHEFLDRLARSRPERRIGVRFALSHAGDGLALQATDEDGIQAESRLPGPFEPARDAARALDTIRRQLERTGDTEFISLNVDAPLEPVPFAPISALNALRRDVLARLSDARASARPRRELAIVPNEAPFPDSSLTYLGNVLNEKAAAFYRRHGVREIEPAAESGLDLTGRKVMTTRYCVRRQLGLCPHESPSERVDEPLFLVDEAGNRLELAFDCAACEMEIYLADAARVAG